MTGKQLAFARKKAGVLQKDLAKLLGVHVQTVGSWERVGDKPIESRKETDALADYYLAMQQLGAMKEASLLSTEKVIPSPFDYFYYIGKGELLILSDDEADMEDLVITYDENRNPTFLGRVTIHNGIVAIIDQQGKGHRLPKPDRYKVIELSIHQHHNPSVPVDSFFDAFPPEKFFEDFSSTAEEFYLGDSASSSDD